jgi:hypothetical protein
MYEMYLLGMCENDFSLEAKIWRIFDNEGKNENVFC